MESPRAINRDPDKQANSIALNANNSISPVRPSHRKKQSKISSCDQLGSSHSSIRQEERNKMIEPSLVGMAPERIVNTSINRQTSDLNQQSTSAIRIGRDSRSTESEIDRVLNTIER